MEISQNFCGLLRIYELYNPLFEGKTLFFKEFFFVDIQYVQLDLKSGLQSRAGYDGACTVSSTKKVDGKPEKKICINIQIFGGKKRW